MANPETPQLGSSSSMKFILDLTQILFEPGKNLVVSPFSLVSALAMVLVGSEHPSSTELAKVLFGGPGEKKEDCCKQIAERFTSVLKQFFKDNESVLNNANMVYTSKQFNLKADYQKTLTEKFMAVAKQLDFDKPEAKNEINQDVAKATKNLIKDMVDSIDPAVVLILVNAIYFKGLWKFPFDKAETQLEHPFNAGEKKVKVPMMVLKKKFPHYYCPELKADTLRMEYSSGTLSMVIILPDQDTTLQDVIKNLDQTKLNEILNRMDCFQEVQLKLPRFKVESKHELIAPLKRLGIMTIFSDAANLSGMSDDKLVVSDIVQKAVIEVNEEGTEAAAATMIMMLAMCALPMDPHQFTVDRSFIFMLIDNQNQHVLFTGVVHDPTQT